MIERFAEKVKNLSRIALAVSGGADSMCMTLLSYQIKKLNPIILIVDHSLRSESLEEATFVKDYINNQFGFEVRILSWNREKELTNNIQSRARDARYNLLTNECKKMQIDYLFTAHNKNDQAETILMNIMRGTGIDGLSGIGELITVNNVSVLRPLLHFTREEITKHLKLHDVKWIEDPSNQNEKFERVKMRKLMQMIDGSNSVNAGVLVERLNLLSRNSLRVKNFLSNYVRSKIATICSFWHLGITTIDVDLLLLEDEEIILRLLREIIRNCGGQQYYVRSKSLTGLYFVLLSSYKEQQAFTATLGGCMIWLRFKNKKAVLVVAQEVARGAGFCSLKQNELKDLKLALSKGCVGRYIIHDKEMYYKSKEMIENVPEAHKTLSALKCYHCFLEGKNVLVYQELGIAKILDQ